MELIDYIRESVTRVDARLDLVLPAEDAVPSTIHKAMRYSVFAGGKKMRAILCLAACEACGGDDEKALLPACAVEMIHTYSLIHDDLPCMDNDDMRRGKPTSHKVFGEGMALLAGDALLTQAFSTLSVMEPTSRYAAADFVRELAVTSDSHHLIGGQVLDLEGEGKQLTLEEVEQIHAGKTSALISCAAVLGGMSADADERSVNALRDFAFHLGHAFQIIDDILDVTSSSEKMGKTVGKDVAAHKSTYPALVGLEASREYAGSHTRAALESIGIFGDQAFRLRQIADYLLKRDY